MPNEDPRGLSPAQIAERVSRGQTNRLPPRGGRTTLAIIRDNVFTRINAILTILLVIVLATGSWINAAFGLLIIANSAIGIVQELRAKRTLDSLAVVGEAKPVVRRIEGTLALDRERVVLDDIIELGPGDQIVVDGVIVEEDHLEIDESLLTGESDPEPKVTGDEVMSGSFVVSGGGAYRATKVGADAYAAQLTAEASRFTLVHSELQLGINRILRIVTWLLVPVGAATVVVQLLLGEDWRQAVLRMAGALVPMVPEGLVLLTSMAFALGVIRLGRRQCLVQELAAIEGLARVDVVCADKTGTLTQSGMLLSGIEPLGDMSDAEVSVALARVCSADERPNASVQAILQALGVTADGPLVVARAPFTSAKKWSGVSFSDGQHWVLGAPDVLATGQVAARAEEQGADGLRVLMLARIDVQVDADSAPGVVTPVALVALDQRVRSDAAETLKYFADQGIEVKIISGDNARSVGAVTHRLGMAASEPVDARTLDTVEALARAMIDGRVFGRVTPHQKRAMIAALQLQGHVVAMTGDGVNDVLALKDADLGVAMGSGAPAARSVAKIVLLDDRFATLPHVVAEGRRVLANIERVANLFLTKTVYSAILALLVVIWRVPFPFLPIHVTIAGWFTIGIPAFVLSLPPSHDRARPGFVRRVLQLGVPAGLVVAAASFAAYLIARGLPGVSAVQSTTASLTALILSATWVLSVIARPYAWWKVALVAVSLGAYSFIFTWPAAQRLVFLDSSNSDAMGIGIALGCLGAVCIEATWWIRGWRLGEPLRMWQVRNPR